ncbi:MAG: type I-C CRISPR-associated endonuclease Cas1 [Deltaproteobacteria bacterium]|nr:type I-C CRISPR-associated endonuclease Cas1 [Deltaproteobacteria bacterium]
MKQLLNTLYVMTQGAYLTLDHETVKVEIEGKIQLQVPLHHLGAIFTVGNIMLSPFLVQRCAEDGRAVVLLDRNGKFGARIIGRTTGNVLLRKAQYDAVQDIGKAAVIARNIVAGKIQNSRQVLLRSARESTNPREEENLRTAARVHSDSLAFLEKCFDIDVIRGIEGESANAYFQVFDKMIKDAGGTFEMRGRNRRPPRDPINALLSFFYTLLLNDCVSALEGVGLDPQMGFLHSLRPGRPSLGLDLMEEFRPILADRQALTLINLKQITGKDFEERPGGAVYLKDEGRKTVLMAYQKRKQDEFTHPLNYKKYGCSQNRPYKV